MIKKCFAEKKERKSSSVLKTFFAVWYAAAVCFAGNLRLVLAVPTDSRTSVVPVVNQPLQTRARISPVRTAVWSENGEKR